LKKILNMKI